MFVTDKTMNLFLRISEYRVVGNYLPKVRRCLDSLNTQQLWEHETHEANSVGGILLHICEQFDRHTARYNQVGTVTAAGIEDYFPDMGLSPEELVAKIEETFTAWQRAIHELLSDESRVVDLFSIYHLIEHTSYHLGQIVDRVQRKTGESFQFVQKDLNERSLRAIVEDETVE
ncbi:hypothetical protein ATW55_14415 [Ferroacidibacillus organovorans]|uniref:DinB-like domain-containing protein n=1 Tax=Ferroacidibacillus organovorans TaxID=1765683 RepID=A0A117SXX6_9BACL|nr:hypothetical protein ATW55_14415 [Ferroacidibacillus organovorans]